MPSLRSSLKGVVFLGCRAFARRDGHPRHTLLLYHSIGGGATFSVRARQFARQVQYLVERFEVVRLDELPERIGRASRPLASITFDDGYIDNYEVALPILERFGAKATFFLLPTYLGRPFPTSRGEHQIVTVEQARELFRLGHEIGAHTMTHPKLTTLDLPAARFEVIESKKRLEDVLGSEVRSFAYPKGDVDANVRSMVQDAGFRCAATVRPAPLPERPDWLMLPRLSVTAGVGMLQYRSQLSGALDVYQKLTGRRI